MGLCVCACVCFVISVESSFLSFPLMELCCHIRILLIFTCYLLTDIYLNISEGLPGGCNQAVGQGYRHLKA